jgi:hypothetical protein
MQEELFDSVLKKNATLEQLETQARKMGLVTKQGNKLHISTIHRILNNSFYYGKFEWPENSGEWHKGKHRKMITVDEFQTVFVCSFYKPKYLYTYLLTVQLFCLFLLEIFSSL